MSEVFLDQIDSVWRVSLILVNIGLALDMAKEVVTKFRDGDRRNRELHLCLRLGSLLRGGWDVTVSRPLQGTSLLQVCDRSIPVPAERLANQFTVLPVSGMPEAAAGNPLINTFDASCYFAI
jgi:hypothetical protein